MIADKNLTPLNPDEPGELLHPTTGKLLDERSRGARSGWKAMLRAIDRGEQIDQEQQDKNIALAVEFRDDPRRADRVRAGAIEFLDGLIERGIRVAMHLDKLEREKAPVNAVVLVKVIEGVNEELL